jgi:hypothetical protein
MAGNLFTGTGYFLFSGVANFGDWAAVIHGLEPYWIWRVALVVVGIVSYYASMVIVAAHLQAFRSTGGRSRRLRDVSWTPYFTDGVLAAVAGLFNPAGLFYVIASALPSTLGANAGLLWLPWIMRRSESSVPRSGPVLRSNAWIIPAVIASLLFIFVLGRGLTWSR